MQIWGKHKVRARAGKYKLGATAGKYKFGTRAGKHKVGARADKYKLGARAGAGGREIQTPYLSLCFIALPHEFKERTMVFFYLLLCFHILHSQRHHFPLKSLMLKF